MVNARQFIVWTIKTRKNMKKHIIRYASFALAILGMVSCSEEQETALRPQDAKSTPMTFLVNHPGQATRATETSFEQDRKSVV